MTPRPTFLLDGVEVPFEPGQTVMQAALAAGRHIPHLCYHPEFRPHGSCKVRRADALRREIEDLDEPCPDLPFVQDPKDRIRALPRAYDPAEKMLARGPSSLSHGELLALVLGTRRAATRGAKVAERLQRRHGLQGLARVRPGELNREPGVGPAAAARISAVFELGRRIHGKDPHEARPRLTKPREVFERVRGMARARKEHLVGLYLDAQNGLVHRETLSVGSLNTTRTHPREILYPAIVHLALGFILVHNHPQAAA